jgi:5-methylcytosine-specific restriction endonuclease McrBC GTP-binding regulatory subunit McrB
LQELLRVINDRLTVLKDSDHTIGHAFFINCEDLESIKLVFADKIIPLLQEFFYGEIHKAELVLGKAFIKQDQNIVAIHGNSLKNLKAKPAFISRNELLQLNFNAFTGIYEQ